MMKNTVIAIVSLFAATACTSQTYLDKPTVDNLVANQEFTFMAQKAHPTNYDVINVMNSMPNSTSSRILNLSYGYDITLKDKELSVHLPYFGRSYTASTDPTKNGLDFTTRQYSVKKAPTKKGYVIVISPEDVTHIRAINIEVYNSGSAYVSIDANDRQPISYSGYIMRNESKK